MKYFNYKNSFDLTTNQIRTDRGQVWELSWLTKGYGEYGLYTNWWRQQYESDLRGWQKDILRIFGLVSDQRSLALVYERGQGFSQPHDIALGQFKDIAVIMTEQDTWIGLIQHNSTTFLKQQSLGSVLDPKVRKELFKISQELKKELA